MGVAHLTTHLRPYGIVKDLRGQDVVIDGPGLTYHIYYICCASQYHARNPFEAIPSYYSIGEAVLEWLNELTAHGVVIKKIYFDGLLPASKREVRISRLMSYTKQLSHYHDAWPQIIPRSQHQVNNPTKLDLFGANPGPSSASQLPAAPFIVPTVIEVLKASEIYGPVTEVVPNEADMYCAASIRLHQGVVFTSDSDLLVHDLGTGAVSFFKDIEYSEADNCFRSLQYEPAAIASRLGLPSPLGMRALAFELLINPNSSLPQLLKRAATSESILNHQTLYQDFALQYDPLAHEGATTARGYVISRSTKTEVLLKSLDPRISEYILQCEAGNWSTTESYSTEHPILNQRRQIDVYLPFLLDCPSKTSAWENSTSVRQLAYGLVNILLPPASRISSVIEHRRQQSLTQGREWQLPTIDELPKACEDVTVTIEKFHNLLERSSDLAPWNGIAIYQDLNHAMITDKKALSEALILHFSSTETRRISWDAIQFSAQLQASYYSFRILKQTLDVVTASMDVDMVHPSLEKLQQVLETLPKLTALPSFNDELCEIGNESKLSCLKCSYMLLGINASALLNEDVEKSSKRKKQKKRKKETPRSHPLNGAADLSTNLYDVLNID